MKIEQAQPGAHPEEDEPLDPAMERVRRKMVRLLAISIGMMLVGIFAVLFVVIVRLTGSGGAGEFRQFELAVPEGFSVVSASSADGRITLSGADAAGTARVLIFDEETGAALVDATVVGRSSPAGAVPE